MDYTGIINNIASLHKIPNMDKEYVLYYDETNNARVFKLTEEGFNFDEHAYFILGGLAFEKGKILPQTIIDELINSLNLQVNMNEIKFKHIKQKATTFIDLLAKPRFKIFLEWLNKNNCWIHYSYLDNFYFSIVDIIDTLPESAIGGLDFSRNLKDTLYFHIKRDRDWFVNFMRYFEYPNITEHQQFINELLRWIEKFNPVNEDFNMEYIRQSLKANKKEDLALLKSNKAGILIENYYSLYANSIVSYYNSEHIFDEEYTIQEKFEEIPVEFFGQKANYKFIKSDNDVFIQLSDIVVSTLRMWMTMLEGHSLDELQQLYFTLSNDKKDMMRSIQHLMMNSMSETYGFKHGIGSDRFEKKIAHFLEFNF
ncbi:hypothetical protein BA718_11075 [Streptococcus gallolyticus subsp. gallolyticus]|uniref:DUF3800 domain-containing protein n=1 Tax=Streptococcus gallolyticus TaxID=315405 RepID=UPI0007E34348|nr:DUF3800 domain-containing protein [Streptococcus gallolyticus]OAV81988.1 hypothetical protein A3651_11045 [Streptococcus gallolyticus subsp. gallolyticus]OCW49510.1 hypothetical protein BA718_11075 [Streptococcus gallolyticus subsp. gallolyticus]